MIPYMIPILNYTKDAITLEEMEGLKFSINAKSFYQTNSDQAYELYKITRDFAGLTGNEIVYDLYTNGNYCSVCFKKSKK
jgi:23S rRNA (uracil1939-C5)-methyltransferase